MPKSKRRSVSRRTSYYHRKRKKRQQSFYFWALTTIAAVVFIVHITSQISSTDASALSGGQIPEYVAAPGDHWWDPAYSIRHHLDTKDKSDTTQFYKFDHSSYVASGSSTVDGADIRLVAQVDEMSESVAFELQNPNTAGTIALFDISRYPNADYYLYHGGLVPPNDRILGTARLSIADAVPINASAIQTPSLSIESTSTWVIKYHDHATLTLDIQTNSDIWKPESKVYYSLEDAEELTLIEDYLPQEGTLSIDIPKKAKAGDYSLFIVTDVAGTLVRSNTTSFILSAPMFVAWTIDWEGRDVEDWALKDIGTLAEKYSIPITQFFNPRIYISKQVPPYRRDIITDWVMNRVNIHGDELALHMHMYFDMVEAAGVTPRLNPHWGAGVDGYDVLTSGYTYEEFTQILGWAFRQFAQNDLPKPEGYRAGGWFADLEILEALNDFGFTYDSSGRELYEFGAQKQEGYWNLSPSVVPYQPSTSDQNSPNPDSHLNIWELPNNGNDSYWFSGEHLLNRFYANYKPGEVLDEPRMVTYLTHPDWYSTDKPKNENLFAEIVKYSHQSDLGPVVFTTLSDTIPEWESITN